MEKNISRTRMKHSYICCSRRFSNQSERLKKNGSYYVLVSFSVLFIFFSLEEHENLSWQFE